MTSNTIYSPEEDSYFLSSILKRFLKLKNRDIKILDMGSGTGIQAETCISLGFKNVLAADINPYSLSLLKKKHLKAKVSDLFSNIREKFELIIFNPPYLPYNKYDKNEDTSGGKKGYETIIKFLKQAKSHLIKKGKILLLFSSFSSPRTILRYSRKIDYKYKKIAEKRLFFEKIFIYEFFR